LSSNPSAAIPGAPAAAPVPNDAWYLHSQGRRFGPLTEDDMRGYFRAAMVKGNDTIGVPGQVGTVPASEAAAMLGMPAPAPAPVASAPVGPAAPTYIQVTETGTRTSGVLIGLGLLVAVCGFAYFKLHVPEGSTQAAEPVEIVQADEAPAAPAPVQAEWTPGSSSSLLGSAQTAEPAGAPAATTSNEAAAVASNPAMQAAPSGTRPASGSDAWWNQASELFKASDWPGLEAHSLKWTLAEPRRDIAYWYLGSARHHQGNYSGAIEANRQGLVVNPSHFKMRWAMANSYQELGQHRESVQLVQGLIREQPGDARLWTDLGYDWAQLGEYNESVAALEKAVQLDPNYRLAWQNLVWAYAKFGYPDKSKDALARGNSHM
jgi:hypothetical protein